MNKLLSFLCFVFIFIAMIFQASGVYANEILESVTVSDAENGGYNITLGNQKPAQYDIRQISEDKIIIKINNITPSKDISTKYSNASSLEHVIIKPVFGGTVIEISGENAGKSSINLLGGIKKSSNVFWGIFLLIPLVAFVFIQKKSNRKEFKTTIRIADEENQILKVSFERKGGLIAKGTGAKSISTSRQNVRKVVFSDIDTIKELNLR